MNYRLLLALMLCCSNTELYSQALGIQFKYERLENDVIPPAVHKERRDKIVAAHSNKALILSLSADVRNRLKL